MEKEAHKSLFLLWVVTLLSSQSVRNINYPLCGYAAPVIQKAIMRLIKPIYSAKVFLMVNKANSLAHTKWMC